jgi:hypothetical protein
MVSLLSLPFFMDEIICPKYYVIARSRGFYCGPHDWLRRRRKAAICAA